jgi:branched-chain amino acid transport system permease protein
MPGWVVFVVAGLLTGSMMVLGMYATILLNQYFGLDPLAAAPLVAGGLFLLGYALQRGLVNRYILRPEHEQFVLLLAVGIILTSSMLIGFGPDPRSIQTSYSLDSYEIAGLVLDKVRVLAAAGAVACVVLLGLFFRFTRTGKAVRACADNPIGALVVGLDVKRLYAVAFGLGAACVGAAGTLLLLLVDVQPYLATDYTLLAFIIVILGGLGSLAGALLGGLLVGVSEGLAAYFFAPSMKSMFSFGLLILVLLLRPQGLLGQRS